MKRIKTKVPFRALLCGALFCGINLIDAGEATFDFETDPGLEIFTNLPADTPPLRTNGGNPGGYLAITDSVNEQATKVIFPDFDDGLVVKAFKFTMDVRVGNAIGNDGRPADGFSINYARAIDPVLTTEDAATNFAVTGAPETGTSTGLAVSFDAWQGNALPDSADVEGIIVRLDNQTILLEDFGTAGRNAGADAPNSLQTGPYDAASNGDPSILEWKPLEVELDENGQLTVTWKGNVILDHYQTEFFPSPGRLVFAGRTGGANQNQHVDNIHVTTVPADNAFFSGLIPNPNGLAVEITDVTGSEVDLDSLQFEVDGEVIPSDQITASKAPTQFGTVANTIIYRKEYPDLFAPDVTHNVNVSWTTSTGETDSADRNFTVLSYKDVPADYMVGAGSDPGFRVRSYSPSGAVNPNTIVWNEATLRGENGDDASDTISGAWDANNDGQNDSGNPDADGYYSIPTVVNLEINGVTSGNFQDDTFMDEIATDHPYPGISPGFVPVENFTFEAITYLEFTQPGVYTMGVNSDDGFKVSAGMSNEDVWGTVLGFFDAGRGAVDTIFGVHIPEAGVYPFRLLHFQGVGGGAVEWFTVVDDGTKVLINDPNHPESVKAYQSAADLPSNPPRVTATSLNAFFRPIRADQPITASIEGTTDISLTVNGSSDNVEINGGEVTYQGPLLPPGAEVTVDLNYAGIETSISTTVGDYMTVDSAWAGGSASQPGFSWRTHQLAAARPDGNTTNLAAEQQLRGAYGASVADGEMFDLTGVINFNQDAPTAIGNFGSGNAGVFNVTDEAIPGIPGTTGSTNDIAAEALTYIDFPTAGLYQMGVNSDDGFKVQLYDDAFEVDPEDPRNVVLGTFDGGRGATDTLFSISISEPGVYPMRLLWYEGGGGANVEWFTVAADGSRALVNGTQPGALSAFMSRSGGPSEIPELPAGGGGGDGVADTVTISIDGGDVTLGWDNGVLQEADAVTGPFSDSADQTNPQTRAASGAGKYFRVQD